MVRFITFQLIWVCSLWVLPGLAQSDFCLTLNQNGLIFCDDFETLELPDQRYFEWNQNNGDFIPMDGIGRQSSRGMRALWQAGEVGAGGLSKSFGRTPSNYIGKHAAYPDSTFTDIYWRMDVKMQEGWLGDGPDKLSRALCLANSNWATGAMAHLWSGGPGGQFLGMDPASGIDIQGNLVTTKYNDFPNMRWLGFKAGNIPLFADNQAGKWFCVEGHVKLNSPGASDGLFEFWINDTFQAGSYQLNWHGDWNDDPSHYGINAIFFENYWNEGSPVEQERYFDNLVIATDRIGCSQSISSLDSKSQPEPRVWSYDRVLYWDTFNDERAELRLHNLWGQEVLRLPISGAGQYHLQEDVPSGLWAWHIIDTRGHPQGGILFLP